MTPEQYLKTLHVLELSQRGAGIFLGIDERTSRRWAAGEKPVPRVVAMLLLLMVDAGRTPEQVHKLISRSRPPAFHDQRCRTGNDE